MAPFIIFTLPRSRSAWLSHLLGCGHDIALDCENLADFFRHLGTKGGTVETGAIIGAQVIRHIRPDIKMAVVRRPVDEVLRSLTMIGLNPIAGEIETRAVLLDQLASEPDVLSLDFTDLDDCMASMRLATFCCVQLSREKFDHYSDFNIQLNIPRRVGKLIKTADNIRRIKGELIGFQDGCAGSC